MPASIIATKYVHMYVYRYRHTHNIIYSIVSTVFVNPVYCVKYDFLKMLATKLTKA